jgi:hypothetical protein
MQVRFYTQHLTCAELNTCYNAVLFAFELPSAQSARKTWGTHTRSIPIRNLSDQPQHPSPTLLQKHADFLEFAHR